MNKEEYLKRLEGLLSDVDAAERQEAIQYYEEYFQDSEKEEADVIKELGSPEEVAHSIREELAEKEIVLAASVNQEENKNAEFVGSGNRQTGQNASYQSGNTSKEKRGMDVGMIILIVLAVIFIGIPIGIPALGSVLGLVLGFFGAVLGVLLTVAICFVVFAIVAVICFVVSIGKLFVEPLAGIILLGVSLLMLGLCFLCALATWKMCSVVIPALVRGVVYLCKLPFQNKKEATV